MIPWACSFSALSRGAGGKGHKGEPLLKDILLQVTQMTPCCSPCTMCAPCVQGDTILARDSFPVAAMGCGSSAAVPPSVEGADVGPRGP